MSDAFFLKRRSIDRIERGLSRVERQPRVPRDGKSMAPTSTVLVRATQLIPAQSVGNVIRVGGSAPDNLNIIDSAFPAWNVSSAEVPSGAVLVASRLPVPESGDTAVWVITSFEPVVSDSIRQATASTDFIFGGHGLATTEDEGSGIRITYDWVGDGEIISSGKRIWYTKRSDGSRHVIGADCEDVAPAENIPTGLGSFVPADGAGGQASAGVTLSWSATNADDYDVYFGQAGSVTQVATAQAGTTYATGALGLSKTFHWYVVANNTNGSQQSTVLEFDTQGGTPISGTTTEFSLSEFNLEEFA